MSARINRIIAAIEQEELTPFGAAWLLVVVGVVCAVLSGLLTVACGLAGVL